MTGFASGVMLVLHVATAVVGFGAVIATGVAARAARRSASAPAARRYFRPGPNWASLSLLLVPVFGAALEALQKFPDVHQAWPWVALVLWAVAAAIGVFVHWPAERRIQALVSAAGDEADRPPAGDARTRAPHDLGSGAPDLDTAPPDLQGPCRRAVWSSAAMAVLFVACVGVMVTQPH
jgi:Predicted integral membrane protein (DUF2269)